MRIFKPWICGGRLPEVAQTLNLPEKLARDGIARGLAEPVNDRDRSERPGKPAGSSGNRRRR